MPVSKDVASPLGADGCAQVVFRTARPSSTNVRRGLLFFVLLAASIVSIELLTRTAVTGRPILIDALVIFGAAFASSIAGFAFSALAGAVLLRDGGSPQHALQIIVACSLAIQLLSTVSLRQAIRWRPLRTFLIGGAVGLPAGIYLLEHAPLAVYARGIGFFLLGYGAYVLLSRPRVVSIGPRSAAAVDIVSGMLGGITGGLAGFPGAFVTIWCSLRGWDKARQRALFQPYIAIMQVATLTLLFTAARAAGRPAALSDFTALAFVPIALCGAYLGLTVFARLSDRQFSRILALLLVASGMNLAGLL
ncbi:MAG: sulfite exporter TauE/SafE family protein [Candidatus Velthaea sp.]|jgi:uncharacterized membrane protein YfcA